MAAELIVKLYEYSPVFYISLISVCFILTVALVLNWFGFDVPVIIRSSDEAEALPPAPQRTMVQVLNPFALELDPRPGSVAGGVYLRPYCLEDCVLTCFWGCSIQALQDALQRCGSGSGSGVSLCTAEFFQRALHPHSVYCHALPVWKKIRAECETQIPPEDHVTDFGFLPRDRYPLLAVLTLANDEERDAYNIVASVTVLHVPDEKYDLSQRVLFHYLITADGNMYDLKPLFMSTDSTNPAPTAEEAEPSTNNSQEAEVEEAGCSGAPRKDCVVCQNATVNRVLLPCRHACVCDECVPHFQHCPMCRAFVCESFTLSSFPAQH